MAKSLTVFLLISFLGLIVPGQSKTGHKPVGANYQIAFANFAPLNLDIFVADADGRSAKPLLAHPDLDYSASFSRDGEWIVFTSERNGLADIL